MAKRGSEEWKSKISKAKKNHSIKSSKRLKKLWRDPKWRAMMRLSHPKKGETGKFAGLDQYALQNFAGCHNRVRDGKSPSIQWPRTREGYIAFMKEIGPKPNDGQRWSVGRKNHNLGYQKGNVQWELHIYNSVKRRGTRYELSRSAVIKLKGEHHAC